MIDPIGSLQACDVELARRYDVALLDLDGVVYVGGNAVPHASDALAAARDAGMRLAFVTNNAARTPETVATHLGQLGISADPGEVITSAQAAAHHLARQLPAAAQVLVVGTTGLVRALREAGLEPVEHDGPDVAAVVQGFSPELGWRQLCEGMLAIGRGVPWVATNLDRTVPSPRGQLPGNGSMVAALRHASGAEPVSVGKPDPRMHAECIERTGARRPLVVGDRLDTDIEGANAVGCASLLVLTGVTGPAALLVAPAPLRPTYLARDLRGLLVPHPAVEPLPTGARCRGWRVTAMEEESTLLLSQPAGMGSRPGASGNSRGPGESGGSGGRGASGGSGGSGGRGASGGSGGFPGPGGAAGRTDRGEDSDLDALRALCAAAWRHGPQSGRFRIVAGDAASAEAIAGLGLEDQKLED